MASNVPAGLESGMGNDSGNRPAGGTPHTSPPRRTKRHEKFKRPRASGLRIMQVNVQRGCPKHKAALQAVFSRQADVVLIQEPATIIGRRITQYRGAFQTLVPQDAWPIRPRVVTYVQEGSGLIAVQPCPGLSRDLLQVGIQGPGLPTLYI